MPDLSESFWISVAYGVDDEAKAQGATIVKANAGGDNNVDQQISQIQDLIQRRVDALIVGATDGNAVKAVVNQAAAAGIPALWHLQHSEYRQDRLGRRRGPLRDGQAAGPMPRQAIGGKGKVAAMQFPAGQSWADERARGFMETMESEFPDIEIVAEDRIATVRSNSLQVMERLDSSASPTSTGYTRLTTTWVPERSTRSVLPGSPARSRFRART